MALGLAADRKAQEELVGNLLGIAGDEPRARLGYVKDGTEGLDPIREVLDAGTVSQILPPAAVPSLADALSYHFQDVPIPACNLASFRCERLSGPRQDGRPEPMPGRHAASDWRAPKKALSVSLDAVTMQVPRGVVRIVTGLFLSTAT